MPRYNDGQSKGNELVLEKRADSFKNIFIYFGCAGLHYCMQAFSICGKQGFSLVVMHDFSLQRLLLGTQAVGTWASVVVACRL